MKKKKKRAERDFFCTFDHLDLGKRNTLFNLSNAHFLPLLSSPMAASLLLVLVLVL